MYVFFEGRSKHAGFPSASVASENSYERPPKTGQDRYDDTFPHGSPVRCSESPDRIRRAIPHTKVSGGPRERMSDGHAPPIVSELSTSASRFYQNGKIRCPETARAAVSRCGSPRCAYAATRSSRDAAIRLTGDMETDGSVHLFPLKISRPIDSPTLLGYHSADPLNGSEG